MLQWCNVSLFVLRIEEMLHLWAPLVSTVPNQRIKTSLGKIQPIDRDTYKGSIIAHYLKLLSNVGIISASSFDSSAHDPKRDPENVEQVVFSAMICYKFIYVLDMYCMSVCI